MDEQNQAAPRPRNFRHSACDSCREYKVKCSGSRSKCDRCARLNKNCTFSEPRLRSGQRKGHTLSKMQGIFIHSNQHSYESGANNNQRGPTESMLPLQCPSCDNENVDSSVASTQNSTNPCLPSAVVGGSEQSSARPQSRATSCAGETMGRKSPTLPWPIIDDSLVWPMDMLPTTSSESWCWDTVTSRTDASSGASTLITDWGIRPDVADDGGDKINHDQIAKTQTAGMQLSSRDRLEPEAKNKASCKKTAPSELPEDCTCVQKLTVGLFELSKWKTGHLLGTPDMRAGEYLELHHNCLDTWNHLIRRCPSHLVQPQFVQLLILSIEQLINIHLGQIFHRQSSTENPTDTIEVGEYVVNNSVERMAVVKSLLQIKTSQLRNFIHHLLACLPPIGMADLGTRLESCLSNLTRPREGSQ